MNLSQKQAVSGGLAVFFAVIAIGLPFLVAFQPTKATVSLSVAAPLSEEMEVSEPAYDKNCNRTIPQRARIGDLSYTESVSFGENDEHNKGCQEQGF